MAKVDDLEKLRTESFSKSEIAWEKLQLNIELPKNKYVTRYSSWHVYADQKHAQLSNDWHMVFYLERDQAIELAKWLLEMYSDD